MITITVLITILNLLRVQCLSDAVDPMNRDGSISQVRWAITSLILPGHDFSKRNAKVAAAMKPYAKAHSFTFIFFSEFSFPQQEVDSLIYDVTTLARQSSQVSTVLDEG